jgi:hypothetical protein
MPIPTVCLGNGERCLGTAMHGRVHCGRHQVSDRPSKPRIFAKFVTIVPTSVNYFMSFPFPPPEYTHHSRLFRVPFNTGRWRHAFGITDCHIFCIPSLALNLFPLPILSHSFCISTLYSCYPHFCSFNTRSPTRSYRLLYLFMLRVLAVSINTRIVGVGCI